MKIIAIIAIVTLARFILLQLGRIENQFIGLADNELAMADAFHKKYVDKPK